MRAISLAPDTLNRLVVPQQFLNHVFGKRLSPCKKLWRADAKLRHATFYARGDRVAVLFLVDCLTCLL
jgi:hypothetical protein